MKIEFDPALKLNTQAIEVQTKPHEESVKSISSMFFDFDPEPKLDSLNFKLLPTESVELHAGLDYEYVAIDTLKLDSYLDQDEPHAYLPPYIQDLMDSSFSFDPIGSFNKSKAKLVRIASSIEGDTLTIHCPVMTERGIGFAQGRHRYWMLRAAGMPFFIAAMTSKTKSVMGESGLLFDLDSIVSTTA